ncbi:MAG: CHASE2 domain-containing protein [Gammaproteobacteria bacterium]
MLKQRILRYGLGIVFTFLFILHASNNFPIPILHTLENLTYDFRLRMTLPDNVDKKVVIIDIDEKSLSEIGQWPWDRNILAQIVDNLFDRYNIRVLGFDILFAENDEDPSDQYLLQLANSKLAQHPQFKSIYNRAAQTLNRDQRFADALAQRNTVLGIVFDLDNKNLSKGVLPEPIPNFTQEIIDRFAFSRAEGYSANIKVLQDSALTAGYFDNPLLDEDGIFRRVSMLQEYHGQIYESLSLAVARAALKNNVIRLGIGNVDESSLELNFLEWIFVGEIAIPVDADAGALIPYIGKQYSFEYISAIDVLNNNIPRSKLANKIALLGTSAAGLRDLRTTPLQASFPGVEIHANIIQGILDQTIKHKPEYLLAYEVLLLLIIGFSLTFILPIMSPIWGSVVTLGIATVMVVFDFYAWSGLNMVVPAASPLLLILLLYGLNMTYGFFVESRGKRKITHLFGQYVPPDLVDEMSKNLKEINLDGEIRDMSVLFTDVRNFTTISENMEPKELTEFINAFLTPLTRAIHQNRGTIDKYMGDAVMAFWGAPLHDDNHARNALVSGMKMLNLMKQMRQEFHQRGWPEIHIGVGVNSGPMNVGNKGSEFRVDYTVLGDAVNLGSRMESLTKTYGVEIITSETTRYAVPEFEYRELDLVKVKGKDKPVTIYEPLGFIEGIDKNTRQSLKQFHHALSLYRAQKWDDAEQEIFALNQQEPDRRIYKIYLDRIAYFRAHPPGENWDGIFTHTRK